MSHPYRDLGPTHFWSRSVASPGAHEIDPVVAPSFQIGPNDAVATMGSCFAQNLSRFLRHSRLNYFVAETGDAGSTGEFDSAHGFGVFSARYGNVYTVRQAVQLFDRAFDAWNPNEPAWQQGSAWVDPFRPQVEPGGFSSIEALELDRESHLKAVRSVFEQSSVLVFTLGLTEGWRSWNTGAIFPVVPGASGGEYDPLLHEFVNFTADEVTKDLIDLSDRVRLVNKDAHVLLTVSPVPLIATYSDQHVLTATTYSKAVLRVAAAQVEAVRDFVEYFPAYEIITGPASEGRYYESDLRSITDAGVNHVMRIFSRHYVKGSIDALGVINYESLRSEMSAASRVVCDEEVLDER